MLVSENIYLKPIDVKECGILYNWINNRDLVLKNGSYKPVSEISHNEWFNEILRSKDVFIFGIYLSKGNVIIGYCQLHSISSIHRSAELQIRIGNTDELGKGYGTEAVKLLVKFAFNDLNLNRVFLHVFVNNVRAIRAYEKVGFKKEGTLRKAAFIDGEYVDVNVMGILREDVLNILTKNKEE